ncbi:MAG: hypothetical protein M3Z96_00215 [Pseudomonadota bacterium]|nr:hypothetical protein [Pseudomonadota bacterium]
MIAVRPPPVLVPPPVIAHTNPPPRGPAQHIVNQAAKPPTNEHAAPPPPKEPPRIARLPGPRPNSGVSPKDEHCYVPDEVLFELRAGVSPQTADEIARGQRLQRLASQSLELTGTTLYRYKIKDKRSVPTVVAALENDPASRGFSQTISIASNKVTKTGASRRNNMLFPKCICPKPTGFRMAKRRSSP